MNYLDKIIEFKKEELPSLKRKVSLQDVKLKVKDAKPALGFTSLFKKEEINIIAEFKRASPSLGFINPEASPVKISKIYEENGAKAISVLTDENFFKGSLADLEAVKASVGIPVLRKDFTVDEYHIYQARAHGADAILLIVAALDDFELNDYQHVAEGLGMKALIEVHDENELKRALKIKPALVGVNNRNLHTFKTSLQTSLDLISKIPDTITAISESGLKTSEDLQNLQKSGFAGFLIGESLMKEKNVGAKLKELIKY